MHFSWNIWPVGYSTEHSQWIFSSVIENAFGYRKNNIENHRIGKRMCACNTLILYFKSINRLTYIPNDPLTFYVRKLHNRKREMSKWLDWIKLKLLENQIFRTKNAKEVKKNFGLLKIHFHSNNKNATESQAKQHRQKMGNLWTEKRN